MAGNRYHRHEMETMKNKWFNLSAEEKSQFKQEWKNRFDSGQMPEKPEGPVSE